MGIFSRVSARARARASIKQLGLAGMALLAFAALPAAADPKVKIACTATADCGLAMVARDEGIFAKHGLDVEMTLIGINTNIPPAIISDSIQIGGPTEPVFLQAVDGGLDLVLIAGASIMGSPANQAIAAVARTGVIIKEPKDFIGKKVGAPGIGAYLQVLFRKWLQDKGIDPKDVNFVEVTFPTMSDALKSSAVDVVLTAEPFISRMVKAGVGEVAVRYVADIPGHAPVISYAATRAYADKNPDVVKAFRASIADADALVKSDPERLSSAVSKFTKLPIELVRANPGNAFQPEMASTDLSWWLEVLKKQDMLQTNLDVSKLVIP